IRPARPIRGAGQRPILEPGDPPAVVDRLAAIDHVVDAAFPPRLDALAVQAREIDERRVRLDRPADLDRVREQRPRRPAARRYLHAVLLVVRADLEARGRRDAPAGLPRAKALAIKTIDA